MKQLLNRLTWILWTLSLLAIAFVMLFPPLKPGIPLPALANELANSTIPQTNFLGLSFALVGGILGNRWCWLAIVMHLAAFILTPSFGYA